jgi:CDP-glycerol glycerophosphotransferase
MFLCWLKPVKPNKVIIMSYWGKGFGDNGKPIALKLMELYPEIDIVWATNGSTEGSLPEGIRGVKYNSLKFYIEMATAGVWLNNCRMSKEIIKRKGQFYIQLWHGGVPLKKIEKDTQATLEKTYIEHAIYDSQIADVIISGCDYYSNIVRTAFWYNGEILECGTPRLDAIFSITPDDVKQIRNTAGLPTDKKVILYAPTFRVDYRTDCYKIDFERVLNELKAKTGDEWVFAVRLHPNVAWKADFINYSDRVINATEYPDLYELIPASDAVISDFSSLMFEAGMLEKPVFLFATDIEEYTKDRELYFDMHDLPFVLAESNDEFVDAIQNFDADEYLINLKKFNKQMNYCENGNASQILAERIIKHIKNGKE